MHPTTMNLPIRGALLGSRTMNPSTTTLAFVPSATTPNPRLYHRNKASLHAVPPSTPSSPPGHHPRPQCQPQPRPSLLQRHKQLPPYQSRSTSTSTSTTTTTAATSTPQAQQQPQQQQLDWNTFFGLRTSRRRYNLMSSILTSLGTTGLGVSILSTRDIDSYGTQILGLDPFIVFGLATAASGALGWLMGPFLGGAVWGAFHRGRRLAFAEKEKQFYARIKSHRVDPSTNSIQNPVPDYYGEKISSVTGYRHWLKDQRAYNRKRKVI